MTVLAPPPPPLSLTQETVDAWPQYLEEVGQRWQAVFPYRKTHSRAVAYVEGLCSGAARKNCWQLAEVQGDADPYGFQHLLGRATWSPAAAQAALSAYVMDHLGAAQGVLIVDETGFLKKGRHSAGVARQYSGTAGRIENCQIGVFLAYAGPRGATLLDRALYLPRSWTDAPARLQEVGLAADMPFATKPQLAQQLLQRARAAGVTAAWVVGDSVYGHSSQLRQGLEAQGQAYVLAVPGNEHVWVGHRQVQVQDLVAELPAADWQPRVCGLGAKGPRVYDWQCHTLAAPADQPWGRYLLCRRSREDPARTQAYLVLAPQECALETLVQVAGTRWCIESGFEAAKGEVGLDEYEVRSATGWYRHITLALWAMALLAVIRATTLPPEAPPEAPAESPLEAPPQSPTKKKSTSSLAAFKQSRGLGSA